MNGRIENEIKIDYKIQEKLKTAPFYVSQWHNFLKASGKTASTRYDFITKIIRFLTHINEDIINITPDDITKGDVIAYFASIQITGTGSDMALTSDSYKQTIWSCLNSFLSFMHSFDYIDENYIDGIERPGNKDLIHIKNKRTLLTKEDFSSILDCVINGAGSEKAKHFQEYSKNRDATIMLLFMTTGMRKTALMNLNISDIDFENGLLTVIDKGEIEHQYKLNDKTRHYLRLWMLDRNDYDVDTDALFLSRYGERISETGIDKIVKKYTKAAIGIELSPHKLRAGVCSILYEETHDTEFVRKAIGHSNISTTLRYITTDNKEREKSSMIMGSIFG